ncbi:YncE family protein [Pseudaminobacter arsenicus]|uniref:YncE family protein n=1 Tax=Borborobacter arsenicus TaxID=1851146 RepID=A0A432V7U2_9HYPH|nr:YncE family protein [Pseudaminobacter arsenicus]RUM98226.1 YncE family protein [Pseudaminobacter arsenicus]
MGLRLIIAACALALSLGTALAQVAFDAPDANFQGRVRAGAAEQGQPVYSGSDVKISGQNFKPGQTITILRGAQTLGDGAVTTDQEGKFEAKFKLPDDSVVGTHPLVLTTSAPYHAEIVDLKVSPRVPLSGAEKFDVQANKLVPGLYQSAYSAKSNALFVTSSSGRPPAIKDSALLKVNPDTLAIEAKATPAAAPARKDGEEGGVFAVYGVGVDNASGTVWVTNTRQNTVAVYKQSDLSLVKQFDPGTVKHARDVAIDEKNGKAYVSSTGTPRVAVLDAKSLSFIKYIEIDSTQRGEDFSVGSLQFDATSGKLYAVSLSTGEAAIIDVASDSVEKVFKVEGARTAIGVAYDAQTNRIFVAGQGSDNLLIVDAESGKTLSNVAVGAGALNVTFDPVERLAYVSSRDAGTVTVVDPEGNIVANLENAPLANHVVSDGKGTVYAVNKSRSADDPQGDRVSKIVAKK